ncbi:hypothetical protein ACQE98_03185 [Ornithinimicrobium sp. W1679]
MHLVPRRAVPTSILVAVLLAGCTGADLPSASGQPLAELREWGGMCAEGECGGTLTVGDDGRWTFVPASSTRVTDEGQLSQRQLHQLRGAVGRTRLDVEPVNAPAGRPDCDADHDGRSVSYGWADPQAGWTEVSSCEQHLRDRDPLARLLEQLAERLVPSGPR